MSRIISNESIALFWPMLAITGKRTEYVVHWYPVGAKEKLQWIRVVDTTANITGKFNVICSINIKPNFAH